MNVSWKWVSGFVRVLLLILLTVAVAAACVGFAYLLQLPSTQLLPISTALSMLRIASAFFAILLTLTMLLVAYRVLKAVWDRRARLGDSVTGILFGLALAVVLFPNGVNVLLTWPFTFIVATARDAFDTVRNQLPPVGPSETISSAVLLDQLTVVLYNLATRTLDTAGDWLRQVPLKDTILAATIWVGTASLSAGSRSVAGERRSRAIVWWRGLSAARRNFAGLLVVLICGAYLSVAAVIAIPWLTGSGEEARTLSHEMLQQQLPRPDSLLRPVTFSADTVEVDRAFARLSQQLDNAKTRLEKRMDPNANLFRNSLTAIREAAAQLVEERSRFAGEADKTWGKLKKQLSAPATDALNAFDTQAGQQMTAAERAYFFQSLIVWARDRVTETSDLMDSLTQEVSRRDAMAISWMSGARGWVDARLLEVERITPTPADTFGQGPSASPPIQGTIGYPSEPEVASRSAAFSTAPTPPDPGLGWGPFATVARWLLRTKSIALAQIAGMLGFGLFGAAISVLRWRGLAAKSNDIEGDAATVLINGFSATLVIFLVVNGGLAVFTEGSARPDSYVLFFACLVGAVYSEDVWAWARGELAKKLPTKNGIDPDKEAPLAKTPIAEKASSTAKTSAVEKTSSSEKTPVAGKTPPAEMTPPPETTPPTEPTPQPEMTPPPEPTPPQGTTLPPETPPPGWIPPT
jgi:hypothetical protein